MNHIDFTQPENRCLGNILRLHAETIGERPFLLWGDESLSYAAANDAVNRRVRALRELGLGPGDRLLILLHQPLEFVLLALAANKLGAVWVPVNTDYRGDWLVETINDSRAGLLFTENALLGRLDEVADRARVDRVVNCETDEWASLTGIAAAEPDMSRIHYGDTCAVMWTSGTTGKSKGVMQNHNVWVRAAIHNNTQYELRDDDVAYNCLPLYNSAAWVANVYRSLVGGIACALDPAFSVHEFWDRIRHYGATQTMTLGAMHMFLWNQPKRDDDADNPLRMVNMVPMPEELLVPFCERFGIQGNLQGFGQSEVMLLLSRKDTPERQWKPNALGELSDGVELRMLDDEGREVPAGEVGEFCVRETHPHQIFNGYFDNPQAEADAYAGDWYRTGDLGIRDADGDYFFVDRKKDVIRYKGRNVSSVQVEGIALQHPAVAGAAVYGVRSQELDSEEEIKLDVVATPGREPEPEALARFINDKAPYFCVPRYIEVVDSLPYTPTNKVQKYRLRDQPLSANVWDRLVSEFVLDR